MEYNPEKYERKVMENLMVFVEKVMKNENLCGNSQQSGGVDEEKKWADEDSDFPTHSAVCFACWVDRRK
jgi:hypothetical protein